MRLHKFPRIGFASTWVGKIHKISSSGAENGVRDLCIFFQWFFELNTEYTSQRGAKMFNYYCPLQQSEKSETFLLKMPSNKWHISAVRSKLMRFMKY